MAQRLRDLPVGLVLAEGIDRPDGGGNPSDDCDLEDQTQQAGKWPADGEELKPGQKYGEQQAHSGSPIWRNVT